MSGGTIGLAALLARMEPELSDREVVFCSFPNAIISDKLFLSPEGFFEEREGTTLIIRKVDAERHGIPFHTVLKRITLTVHSSLEAVGLTATLAGRLALHGISANVVAAFYHDHIFVPAADAEHALNILRTVQAEASAGLLATSTAPSCGQQKTETSLKGSCLCGAVRYEVDRLDTPIEHCHCLTCRKAHAAAYASTARVLRKHFRWATGVSRLSAYESSPGKLRRFCSACGTHLIAERLVQPHIILRVATLDDDPRTRPIMHIWTSHDAPWLAAGEGIPRHPEWPPDR